MAGAKTKKAIKILISVLCAVLIFCVLIAFFTRLVKPKYMTDVIEGSFVGEYYKEEVGHDLIFLGDCEAYENISPAALWDEYGISSYIRGTPQQLVWQSYYLLEETLKYEHPKCVVYNVLPMKYGEPQSEAYNRLTLDNMKLSLTKIKDIKASMTEDEKMADYIFPVLRYHSRITELTDEDFDYFFKSELRSYSGYYLRTEVKPVTMIPDKIPLADYSFSDKAWEYLEKMRELCEKEDIIFVLMKAPSIYPVWYDEWDKAISDYAAKNGLDYYNCLTDAEKIGIDFQNDTYDGGLHLNVYGAEKMSSYFGKIFRDRYGVPDRRSEEPYSSVWNEKLKIYNEAKK